MDLEMNQPSNKIIQVGWCIGETNNGNVYTKKSMHVNANEELSEFIINLTGIQQEQVNCGYPLEHVYRVMRAEHKEFGCFINPVVWGHGDSRLLREQLRNKQVYIESYVSVDEAVKPDDVYNDDNWPFGRRIIDVKTLYQAYRTANFKRLSGGLAKAMTKFDMNFEGKKHDAGDDAYNTFRIYCELLKYFKESC